MHLSTRAPSSDCGPTQTGVAPKDDTSMTQWGVFDYAGKSFEKMTFAFVYDQKRGKSPASGMRCPRTFCALALCRFLYDDCGNRIDESP